MLLLTRESEGSIAVELDADLSGFLIVRLDDEVRLAPAKPRARPALRSIAISIRQQDACPIHVHRADCYGRAAVRLTSLERT